MSDQKDDTEMLQAMADAAAGRTLILPRGELRLSRPIRLHSNTHVVGEGDLALVLPDGSRTTWGEALADARAGKKDAGV
jgi:hypothetical protein